MKRKEGGVNDPLIDQDSRQQRLRRLARGHGGGEQFDVDRFSSEDLRMLVHELGVYQAELETQNEELRGTRLRLEEVRDRFRELYEFSPVAYFTLDGDGFIREANYAACKLLEMEKVRIVGREFGALLPPGDARKLQDQFGEVPGEDKVVTLPVSLAGDSPKYLRLEITSRPEQGGDSRQFLVSAVDLTGERLAEEALRLSEKRFRTLAETAPLGIFEADPVGRFRFVNAGWTRITGLTVAQSLDYGWKSVLHPQDVQQVTRAWSGRIGAEPLEQEFRIARTEGTFGWVRIHCAPTEMHDRRPAGYVGTLEDITEQKRMLRELRESEEKFRQLADSMPQVVWSATPDGTIDYVNERFREYGGVFLNPDRSWAWEGVLHPEDAERTLQVWQAALDGGTPYRIEHRLQCANGEFRWHLTRALPVRGEDGKIARWFGTCTDIEELKQFQGTITQARQQAENANEVKSEFLASMSHEIRTPMTVIMSAMELLADGTLPKYQEELVKMAQNSSHALLALVNDILDISRIEAHKIDLHEESCLLSADLERALGVVAGETRRKGLELLLQVAPEVPETVRLDTKRLHQVLTNLLGNAVKFTTQGSIVLRVARAGENLLFSIWDTGIGISERKLDRIFESFTQVDPSYSRSFGGAGLGLAICRGLVELMGGKIWAESREGQGSTFYFTLPLQLPEEEEEEGSSPLLTSFPPLSAHILLAEDDPQLRTMISMILERWDCRVTTAVCGEEAERFWKAGGGGASYDLILMDMRMPKVSGLDATRFIREREQASGRHIPIIALTAHAREEDRRKCLEAGMDDWVSKPIDLRQLHEVVRRHLLGGDRGRN